MRERQCDDGFELAIPDFEVFIIKHIELFAVVFELSQMLHNVITFLCKGFEEIALD